MVLSPSPQIHLVPFDFILFYHSYRESLNQKYFFQNASVIRVISGVNFIKFPPLQQCYPYNDFKIAFDVEVFIAIYKELIDLQNLR